MSTSNIHGGTGWIYYRKVLVRDLFDVTELGIGSDWPGSNRAARPYGFGYQ